MKLFGFMFFGCVIGAIIGATVYSIFEYYKKHNDDNVDSVIYCDETEFNKVGEWAIRYQKMKSFIVETRVGDNFIFNKKVIKIEGDNPDEQENKTQS